MKDLYKTINNYIIFFLKIIDISVIFFIIFLIFFIIGILYIQSLNIDLTTLFDPKPFTKKKGTDPQQETSNMVVEFAKPLLGPYAEILGGLTSISSIQATLMKGVRDSIQPIRNTFAALTMSAYRQGESIIRMILFGMHKMRTILKRLLAVFHVTLHQLDMTVVSFKTVEKLRVDGKPLKKIAKKFVGFMDNSVKSLRNLGLKVKYCLDPKTKILTSNGLKSIYKLELGEELSNNSEVTAIWKFKNNEDIYSWNNLNLTGEHLVLHKKQWIKAKDIGELVDKKVPIVYCLSTSIEQIPTSSGIIGDFNTGESFNQWKVKYNELGIDIKDKAILIGEAALHPDTEIILNNGKTKCIQDLKLGEKLNDNIIVIGIGKVIVNEWYTDGLVIGTEQIVVRDGSSFKNLDKQLSPSLGSSMGFVLCTDRGWFKTPHRDILAPNTLW